MWFNRVSWSFLVSLQSVIKLLLFERLALSGRVSTLRVPRWEAMQYRTGTRCFPGLWSTETSVAPVSSHTPKAGAVRAQVFPTCVHPSIWDSDTDGYCAPSCPGKLQQAYRSTREYYTWKRQQDSRSVSHAGTASSGGPVSHSRAGHCIFASCVFSNCCDKRQVSGEKAM